MATTPEQDGNAAIDEIAKSPNLDFLFDNNPNVLTDDDIRRAIDVERQRRALYIAKKASK